VPSKLVQLSLTTLTDFTNNFIRICRRLAEEWELKYKEMQRQMSELEGGIGKKGSISEPVTSSVSNVTSNNVTLQRMTSTTSEVDGDAYTSPTAAYESHEAEQVKTIQIFMRHLRVQPEKQFLYLY